MRVDGDFFFFVYGELRDLFNVGKRRVLVGGGDGRTERRREGGEERVVESFLEGRGLGRCVSLCGLVCKYGFFLFCIVVGLAVCVVELILLDVFCGCLVVWE